MEIISHGLTAFALHIVSTFLTPTSTMATVHPSRMALIPPEIREYRSDRTRGRSPSPRRSRSRDRDRNEGRGRDSGRGREREDYRASEHRRASPQYEDYRRPPPPAAAESSAPWRQKESMYPPQHLGRSGTNAFQSFLDECVACVITFYTSLICVLSRRRAQRAAQAVNVWPPSPKAAARELYVAEVF